MAGFKNHRDILAAYDAGRVSYSAWRKNGNLPPMGGGWTDMSMATGNPPANYYATVPLAAATLDWKKGLYVANSNGAPKYLARFTMAAINWATTQQVMTPILCDYLLYYPFIDSGEVSTQYMDNTSATLPRYTDGAGVQMFLVQQNSPTAFCVASISYTNSKGVPGRTASAVSTSGDSNGALCTSGDGNWPPGRTAPFIGLQTGDTGVRSVESITFTTNNTGLVALVLVKPIATCSSYLNFATNMVPVPFPGMPTESQFPQLPRIYDGAYLSMLFGTKANSYTTTYIGDITAIWSE